MLREDLAVVLCQVDFLEVVADLASLVDFGGLGGFGGSGGFERFGTCSCCAAGISGD